MASPSDALAWGAEHGYPVAVKASGGGGGRGFRVARGPEEMEAAFLGASGEAARSFANPEVYLERYLDDPRHIEVQLMADAHGRIIAVGDRDCSVQRRHQKLIEEAPAPGIPDETRRAMADAAVALARAVDYRGAGTVEFLLDASGQFAFLEMNTRIQVEHPVTEMTTGIDLVREQILVAGGAPLSFAVEDVVPRGHAIECRINAEDPGKGFAPVPGTIARFRPPAGMGVRVDSAAESGSRIHPAYDSLIAKVVAWGRDRDEATARMRRALIELDVDGGADDAGVPPAAARPPRLATRRGDDDLSRPPPRGASSAGRSRSRPLNRATALRSRWSPRSMATASTVRVHGDAKPATSDVPSATPEAAIEDPTQTARATTRFCAARSRAPWSGSRSQPGDSVDARSDGLRGRGHEDGERRHRAP